MLGSGELEGMVSLQVLWAGRSGEFEEVSGELRVW